MASVRGIIFDIDGTLIDSNDAHAEAWRLGLKENGIEVDFASVRKLIGMGGDQLLPVIADIDSESDLGREASKAKERIFKERFLGTLRPFPEARELVAELSGRGLKLAVASSAAKRELSEFLAIIGVEDYFEATTSADDAESSKPEPDIVLAALRRLGLSGDEVIMIGDTPYDIEAAERAGVRSIAVRCGGWKDRELSGASAVYDDPKDLLAKLDRSPIFMGGGGGAPHAYRPGRTHGNPRDPRTP